MLNKKNSFFVLISTLFLFSFFNSYAQSQQSQEEDISPAQKLEQQNKKYQALEAFSKALNILQSQYVDNDAVNSSALIEKALKGLAADLDPHTTYLTAKQYAEFNSDTSGKFGGIGIIVNPANGKLEIAEVIEGSPAHKAGLKAGDIITAIDDFKVTTKTLEEALAKMRGPVGSQIVLNCLCADRSGKNFLNKQIELEREIIRTKSVTMDEDRKSVV